MPKISVLIPAYNVERYIARCLDSVIGQTLGDLEIIIVNDGSTDGTSRVLGEYAARDSRIRVINHPENLGLLWARKTGVEASTGDYLMFVDSDDALKPYACEKLYTAAVANNADLVIAVAEFCYSDVVRTPSGSALSYGSDSYGVTKAMLNNECSKYVWGKLYERRLLVDNPPEYQKNLNLGEDLVISFHVSRYLRKAICIPDVLYEYYQNDVSLSHVLSPALIRDNVKVLLKTVELSSSAGPDLRKQGEMSAIKRIHALIKKGGGRKLIMDIASEEGASPLFSFRSLVSHLGLWKGLTYYLVTRSDFFAKMA
ncbi:MAG: glycosyltransferase family 2 protein [Bacteroidales bacterium]|nr:glycosyltransferase family 2 protein [Bacteroidales bacterium]